MVEIENLHEIVFSNLDAAKENGYFEPGELLHGESAVELAYDMLAFAADVEHIDNPGILVPHIEEWLKQNKSVDNIPTP